MHGCKFNFSKENPELYYRRTASTMESSGPLVPAELTMDLTLFLQLVADKRALI